MRILRLDHEQGGELDLHPYVTVLGGLDPGLQRRVIDQLARICRADVEGISGLVEAHGLILDIEPQRIAALELPTSADVVVHAEQLPGATLMESDEPQNELYQALQARVVAAEAEVAQLDRDIAEITKGIEIQSRELDEARRSVDEFAVTAHDAAIRSLAEAEELARRRLQAAQALPEPEPRSPEDIERDRLAAQLSEQRRRLHGLETMLDEERLGLLQLLEQLETERAILDDLRAELAEIDPASSSSDPDPEPTGPDPELVAEIGQVISEVAAGPPDAPMVPSLPAAALADQVAAHHQRQAEFERHLIERGLDPGPIQQRLEQARRAEAEAAEAARPRTVSPEDEAEIERLHDIMVDNADKRGSRRSGREATRRYNEASAALDVVLGRYGFETYAGFIMGRTSPNVDFESRQRHEEAKALVAQLERELAEIETSIAEDPHGRMLRSERDEIWRAATEILGGIPDDLEGALRQVMVPGEVDFDAPDRLRSLLRRAGVDTSHAATSGALLALADEWHRSTISPPEHDAGLGSFAEPTGEPTPADRLARQEAVVADLLQRSRKLDQELTAREQTHEELQSQVEATEAALVALDDDLVARRGADGRVGLVTDPEARLREQIAADPTVVAAREQLELVAARLARHQVATERVDRLHADIGEARRAERAAIAQRDTLLIDLETLRSDAAKALDAGSPLPEVKWELTEEGIGPIEWYLLGRVASLRSVSPAGSVPLIINDAFRGLGHSDITGLCAALGRIGETVQVIYLGDEPAMVEWAEAQGLDRAAVVRPGQPAV